MKKLKLIVGRDSKRFKRIVFFGLIIFGLMLLIFPNVTYADMMSSLLGEQSYTKNISDLIHMVSHVVYVFIWPCLVIAGTALDNSLVYGSFLNLDAALWNIWNIMKNFANFALGFMFVYTIVVNLFKVVDGKTDPMKNAVGTIKSTLLAGVLVQMSWFIVAALIDISTVLIYAVGGLPLSMLGTYNKEVADIPIMKMNTDITDDDVSYYYSYGGHNYAPCYLVNKRGDVRDNVTLPGLDGEYIAGRKSLYLSNGEQFESGYCTLNGILYKYEESPGFFCDLPGGTPGNTGCYDSSASVGYLTQLRQYVTYLDKNTGFVENAVNSCFLINAYGVDYDDSCNPICSGYGVVPYTGDVFANTTDGFSLKELLNKSKGWVGPFVTMYSSILNYQELVMDPNSASTIGTLFGFVVNTFFALILFFPMAILAVLLVIRVGYLWVVVAISPILALAYAFIDTNGDSPLKGLGNFFGKGKAFSLQTVIIQIFSPVFVVFTVSLCMIFLSTIYKYKPTLEGASDTLSAFGIECVEEDPGNGGNACGVVNNNRCSYSIMGLVTIRLNAQNYNHGKDMFVWVLMELLATGIVRFFMKFAIEFVGKIGNKDFGASLMKTAESYVTTLPVLKLPGMDKRVGLHAIGIGSNATNQILNNLNDKVLGLTEANEQRQAIENRINGVNKTSVSEVVDFVTQNPSTKYTDLDAKYQKVLSNIGYNATNYNNFVNAVTNSDYKKLIQATPTGSPQYTSKTSKTSSEAVSYDPDVLNVAIKSDNEWIERAKKNVSSPVLTKKGLYVVDYLNGYSGSSQFEVITREDYEKRYFGNTIDKITSSDYNTNKTNIEKYLDQIIEELEELQKLSSNGGTQEETDARNILKNLESDLKSQKGSMASEIRNYLNSYI